MSRFHKLMYQWTYHTDYDAWYSRLFWPAFFAELYCTFWRPADD